jgi:hypothetical protein
VPAETAPRRHATFIGEQPMQEETAGALVRHVQTIESDVAALRQVLDAEELAVSDRQYLTRCFDLLDMELVAIRQYIDGLS